MDYPIRLTDQLRPQLRALRRRAGLTQAQLGQQLGVGQARMAEIEADPAVIGVDQFMRLLAALGVTLVLRDDEPEAADPPAAVAAAPSAGYAATPAAPPGDAPAPTASGAPVGAAPSEAASAGPVPADAAPPATTLASPAAPQAAPAPAATPRPVKLPARKGVW